MLYLFSVAPGPLTPNPVSPQEDLWRFCLLWEVAMVVGSVLLHCKSGGVTAVKRCPSCSGGLTASVPAEGKCVSGEHAINEIVCHSAHYPILSHPFFTGLLRGAAAFAGETMDFSPAFTYGTWREAGRDEFDSSKRVIHGSPLF